MKSPDHRAADSVDWARVRRAFPALERSTYLDTAAGGPISAYALERVEAYYRDLHQNGDTRWDYWLQEVEAARGEVAQCLGAAPDEIAFLGNTSVGLNLAIQMLPPGGVVTPRGDFPSLTLPWLLRGYDVRFIEPLEDGSIPVERIAGAVDSQTRYVAVGQVQFGTGFRFQLEELGEFCSSKVLRLVVDATQAFGVFPTNVRAQRADVLAFGAYKWANAGYGVAPLFVSRAVLEANAPPAVGWRTARVPYDLVGDRLDLSDRASGLELGHPPFAGIMALSGALRLIRQIGLVRIEERVQELTDYLHGVLDELGMAILSPRARSQRSGITMIGTDDPPGVARALGRHRIVVSARGRGLRVSLHYYNNHADIDRLAEILPAVLRSGRSIATKRST